VQTRSPRDDIVQSEPVATTPRQQQQHRPSIKHHSTDHSYQHHRQYHHYQQPHQYQPPAPHGFQVHPNAIDSGNNRKHVYIFLLVVNSNLDSILHRFRDTAAIDNTALRYASRGKKLFIKSLKWKKEIAADKILADFVFRFTYF